MPREGGDFSKKSQFEWRVGPIIFFLQVIDRYSISVRLQKIVDRPF
jgi:hypothetical protein